jgi:two-component system, cell cycle response regulator
MYAAERVVSMDAKLQPVLLLASHDPALLTPLEPALLATGARVDVVLSLEAALGAIDAAQPPTLVLLDAALPSMDPRMNIERLLAAARADDNANCVSIVLITDAVNQNWTDRLAEGVIDDLILRSSGVAYWRVRVERVLRNRPVARELEALREAQLLHTSMDHLTGVYNREAILTMLFRETDRVQRMNSPLSLLLLDIDDFGHWNSRLGNDVCDDLLRQVAARITRLLRSYDVLGRPGKDEFLLGLPGCSADNATMLAERIRMDVFGRTFRADGQLIRLSACFGIASSQGRSPVVVLREAEQALQRARVAGPESIQCYGDCAESFHAPVKFLSSSSGDDLLAW